MNGNASHPFTMTFTDCSVLNRPEQDGFWKCKLLCKRPCDLGRLSNFRVHQVSQDKTSFTRSTGGQASPLRCTLSRCTAFLCCEVQSSSTHSSAWEIASDVAITGDPVHTYLEFEVIAKYCSEHTFLLSKDAAEIYLKLKEFQVTMSPKQPTIP